MALVQLGYRRLTTGDALAASSWNITSEAVWIYPDLGEDPGAVYVRILRTDQRLKGPWLNLEVYSGIGELELSPDATLAELEQIGRIWVSSWATGKFG